jgi:hypothetical protein
MRVDEGRRQDQPSGVDDAVAVRLHLAPELRDDAVVDADVEHGVHPARRVEDASAAHDEIDLGSVPDMEQRHEATSSSTSAGTATGPWVSRS